MRSVDQELRVPVGEDLFCGFDVVAQRAYVAVHAVEGLDRYDDAAFPLSDQRLRIADGHHHAAERVDVVVAEVDPGQRLAAQHPVMRARMDEFVVHYKRRRAAGSRRKWPRLASNPDPMMRSASAPWECTISASTCSR